MNKNKCFGICKETERLENAIATLSNKTEKLIEELEAYKKAYELVCKKLGKYYCCDVYEELVECNGTPCVDCLKADFIQKARCEE